MTKRKPAAPLPSGHVGVYRANDGKRWEAYVMRKDLVLLGVYATKRAAVAARVKYWKAKEARR
jgi:hypothetical protein